MHELYLRLFVNRQADAALGRSGIPLQLRIKTISFLWFSSFSESSSFLNSAFIRTVANS